MSFWPKLWRRSRGRKSSSKAINNNPYASRDINKCQIEQTKSRAEFAPNNGVHFVELVQFISRSSRGWVHVPSETTSTSSNQRNPMSGDWEDEEVTISTAPDTSHEFSPFGPTIPSVSALVGSASRVDGVEREEGGPSFPTGNVVMGLDVKGGSRRVKSRLVISRNIKDEAWLKIKKTATILFVKVLVFSRALEESTTVAFMVAVVVGIWNRGKGTCRWVFEAVTTQLLTTLKPYLSLLHQRKSAITLVCAAPKPVLKPSAPEQVSVTNAMNVTPVAEGSVAQEIGSSSFVFPVPTEETVSTSPHFYAHQRKGDSLEIESLAEPISSAPSPLVESNKLPSTKHCQRLKSKLFKSSPARKGKNSSSSTDLAHSSEASRGSSINSSPALGKNNKNKSSCKSKKPSKGGEEVWDEVGTPKSPLKAPKKVNRSHELFFFRSNHNNRRREAGEAQMEIVVVPAAPSADVMYLSSSHELKFSFRSLGKRKVSRSQEFSVSSPSPPVQDLTLPKSTAERLESLALEFKVKRRAQQEERPSLPSSPRHSPSKRRSSLSKVVATEPTYKKHSSRGLDPGSSSCRASPPGGSVMGGKSKNVSSSSKSAVLPTASAILTLEELKPGLRRVRMTVPTGSEQHGPDARSAVDSGPPPPLQSTAELGRSRLLNREILGSILLLAVLGFLMLGRIPAVFCFSCLCLTLSHIQQVIRKNFNPRDQEELRRSQGTSRLRHETSSSVHWSNSDSGNHGSPSHEKSGLQSS